MNATDKSNDRYWRRDRSRSFANSFPNLPPFAGNFCRLLVMCMSYARFVPVCLSTALTVAISMTNGKGSFNVAFTVPHYLSLSLISTLMFCARLLSTYFYPPSFPKRPQQGKLNARRMWHCATSSYKLQQLSTSTSRPPRSSYGLVWKG